MPESIRSEYAATSIEVVGVVEVVSRRPDNYTRHGTIEEVAAFLDGYQMGLAAAFRDRGTARKESAELDRFFDWLKERLGAGTLHWCAALRRNAVNDESGLQYLADAARTFRKFGENETGDQRP